MSLIELLRGGPAREYLITAAYHTPNGHLHLGHLGGPFLSADVLARHLIMLGHRVTRISATDAREAYVLLTACLEQRSPHEVASHYYRSAHNTLEAFDLHQDAFVDFSTDPWARRYREESDRVANHMTQRGRTEVEIVRLPRSRRSRRFVIGPFALGRCPCCGAQAAGTSCEECGMWFDPDELQDVRSRLAEDSCLSSVAVPIVYLQGGPEFCVAEAGRRFPPGYAELLERFIAYHGNRIHVTHPLGWGVAWRAHDLPFESVHVSYGTGSHAAAVVLGHEYQTLTAASMNPFSRSNGVITILTGGFDAALPSMMLLALMDEEVDWQTYRHHVISRFMLLEGRKFSTSLGHVILGSAYIDSGLSPDLFRMYAARLFSAREEGDFRLADFARYVSGFLCGRVEAAVTDSLARVVHTYATPLDGAVADAVRDILADQASALAVPEADLRRASQAVEDWVVAGEEGLSTTEPYWWLKTLAVLAYPFMPRWSGGLWRCLGDDCVPTLIGFEQPRETSVSTYTPLSEVTTDQLSRLACVEQEQRG